MANHTTIKVIQESFNTGLKNLQTTKEQSKTTPKNTTKLTGSFNAGLKDLQIIVNKSKQKVVSGASIGK